VSRGLLAFLYDPVVGGTSAAQKYSHNVVMLLVVGPAGSTRIDLRLPVPGDRRDVGPAGQWFRNDARALRSGMPFEDVRLDPAGTDELSVVCKSLRRTDP